MCDVWPMNLSQLSNCKCYVQNTFEGDLFRFSWVGPPPSCDQAGSRQPDCSCRQHSGHGVPYHWNSKSHNPLEKGRRDVIPGGLSHVRHRQRLFGNPFRQGHWHLWMRENFAVVQGLFSNLFIYFLQQVDTGFYSCAASNPNGEASWTAYLKVEGVKTDFIIDLWPRALQIDLLTHLRIPACFNFSTQYYLKLWVKKKMYCTASSAGWLLSLLFSLVKALGWNKKHKGIVRCLF